MNIENRFVAKLAGTYRPILNQTLNKSTLHNLGLIKTRYEQSNTELLFRKKSNYGGFLSYRPVGTPIQESSTGFQLEEERVRTWSFAAGETTPVGRLGLRNVYDLDVSSRETFAMVQTEQLAVLARKTGNELRRWAACAVLPVNVIDGIQFNNNKVDTSVNWSVAPYSWDNPTTDVIKNLLDLKEHWYGLDKPSAGGLTVLISSKQARNLLNNQTLIQTLTYSNANPATINSLRAFGIKEFQNFMMEYHNISFVQWDDTYYPNALENDFTNAVPFLDPNHIVIIPRAYNVTNVMGGGSEIRQATPSTVEPFIEQILAPSKDFEYKAGSRLHSHYSKSLGGEVNIPGAYVYSGIYTDPNPTVSDSLKSGVAFDIGMFIESTLKLKYIRVQA